MELHDRRVTVMGLGSFGGGLGAVQFLAQQGARITVTDLRTASQLAEPLAELAQIPNIEYHLGGHQPADFTDTDLLVVSPAVPKENPCLQLAIDAGVPVTSEMNLFWELNPAPVIAVTGSNGKSTTTAMTHAILRATGRTCWLGGNIGHSLLPRAGEISPQDLVVLELSSFQLEDLDRLKRSPHVAIVTNFSANHLDRHGTLANYRNAKQTILRWQTPRDFAILNQDDPDVASWPTVGRPLYFGLSDTGREGLFLLPGKRSAVARMGREEQELAVPAWLSLPGSHNLQNALAAACAACALDASATAIEAGLRGYQALPHRLERVAEVAGRCFYNDSLATTPESAIVALAAFEQPIILFAGGYDKGSDLLEMARAIVFKQTKAVALMGTTGPRLNELLDQLDPERRVQRQICENFNSAFNWAVSQSEPGDILLLSPGCASYDWFRNFVDRGTQFRELALKSGDLMTDR